MLTTASALLLNKPLLRHGLGNPYRHRRNVVGDEGAAVLLPDLECVNLNRYALSGALTLISWIDRVLVRCVCVVCALKQRRNLLIIVDASQTALAFAHLINGARGIRVIFKVSLDLQKETREI